MSALGEAIPGRPSTPSRIAQERYGRGDTARGDTAYGRSVASDAIYRLAERATMSLASLAMMRSKKAP